MVAKQVTTTATTAGDVPVTKEPKKEEPTVPKKEVPKEPPAKKNKAHFVKQLCAIKCIDHESKEAQELYSLTVVQLLTEIKKSRQVLEQKKEEDRIVHCEESHSDDDDFTGSLAGRLGCTT
jgi:hypothetical protein